MRPGRICRAALVAAALASAALLPGATAGAPRPIREARRAALRDVYRRLVAAPLPPKARPVRAVGRGLHLNGPGSIPDTPNVVGMHSYFLSPEPREAVLRWIEAHPPVKKGLQESGSFGSHKKILVKYLGFESPELPHRLRERGISFSVAARPAGGSAIRVDTQAVWITLHPAGARIPAGARLIDVKLRRHGKVRESKVIADRAEVRSIAALIDGFEVSQPGTYSCPELGSPRERLELSFRHRRDGPVLASVEQEVPTGCGRALMLTIHGRHPDYLEEGWVLLKRVRALLGDGAKNGSGDG